MKVGGGARGLLSIFGGCKNLLQRRPVLRE